MEKITILVIDDEIDNRKNLSIILSANNYNVILAEDGFEGITLTKKHKPDLILCDIVMPGKTGHEVFKILSSDKETSVIPFIFLTAKTEVEDIRTGLKLGADDYLLKPVRRDELIETIQMRLKKHKQIKTVSENIEDNQILSFDSKILIKDNKSAISILIKDILFIQAENQYSSVMLKNKNSILTSRSLQKWEEILPGNHFIRVHRSTIINFNEVSRLEAGSSNTLIAYLKNCENTINVSQRFAKKIKNKINII